MSNRDERLIPTRRVGLSSLQTAEDVIRRIRLVYIDKPWELAFALADAYLSKLTGPSVRIECGFCKKDLGTKPCEWPEAGQVKREICNDCYEGKNLLKQGGSDE